MLQFKHFRLSFLLAALTAGFAFSGCEVDDDDDGGLNDGALEDKDGDVTGDSSKEDSGKEDAATKECTKDDDCMKGVDACHISTCKADGKCSAPEAIAVAEGEICCVGDTDCNGENNKNTCAEGACTGKGSKEGSDYKVCVYTAKLIDGKDCCQNSDDGLKCGEGYVCKKAPEVTTKDSNDSEEESGESGSEESGESGEVISPAPAVTLDNKDHGNASVCVECNVADDCKKLDAYKNLNDCQSVACEANACKVTWATGCCFVEATESGNKAVENNGCESADYGCYKNEEQSVTRNLTHNTMDANGKGEDITVTFTQAVKVTSGAGTCIKEADLTACSQACKGKSGVACEEGANALKSSVGAHLVLSADVCKLDKDSENGVKCDDKIEKDAAHDDAPFACNLAVAGDCTRNICNTRDKTLCGTENVPKCCVPTALNNGCQSDEDCYTESAKPAGNGETGSCAKTDDVDACNAACTGESACNNDNDAVVGKPACTVIGGAVNTSSCTEPTTISCNEGEVCQTISDTQAECVTADPCEGKSANESCGKDLFCQGEAGSLTCAKLECTPTVTKDDIANPCPSANYKCEKDSDSDKYYCVSAAIVGACSTAGQFCEWINAKDQFCTGDPLECKTIDCADNADACPADISKCVGNTCQLICHKDNIGSGLPCDGGKVCKAVTSEEDPTVTNYECGEPEASVVEP